MKKFCRHGMSIWTVAYTHLDVYKRQALFYYRYSDRNPAEWNFAIDKNVSKRRTKIDYPFIKAYRRCV